MTDPFFNGELVRLSEATPEEFAALISKAGRDTELMRLMDADPLHLSSKAAVQKWFEKYTEKDLPDHAIFMIRTLDGERLIGHIGLDGLSWSHADSYVGIGIAEREFWGKGYGTDAMRLMLRFAFTELDLHRLTLNVFEYNPRAIRSYEKVGFKPEGRQHNYLNRDGQRWDLIYMGILKAEWQALNGL